MSVRTLLPLYIHDSHESSDKLDRTFQSHLSEARMRSLQVCVAHA